MILNVFVVNNLSLWSLSICSFLRFCCIFLEFINLILNWIGLFTWVCHAPICLLIYLIWLNKHIPIVIWMHWCVEIYWITWRHLGQMCSMSGCWYISHLDLLLIWVWFVFIILHLCNMCIYIYILILLVLVSFLQSRVWKPSWVDQEVWSHVLQAVLP